MQNWIGTDLILRQAHLHRIRRSYSSQQWCSHLLLLQEELPLSVWEQYTTPHWTIASMDSKYKRNWLKMTIDYIPGQSNSMSSSLYVTSVPFTTHRLCLSLTLWAGTHSIVKLSLLLLSLLEVAFRFPQVIVQWDPRSRGRPSTSRLTRLLDVLLVSLLFCCAVSSLPAVVVFGGISSWFSKHCHS